MQRTSKRVITTVLAFVLLATGSLFAASEAPVPREPASDSLATYLSGRVSTLLVEIQKEAGDLRLHADTLATFVRSTQISWQTHGFYLEAVKDRINAVGERVAELQRIGQAALPWQQQAIAEVSSHAAQIAASTQAALIHLREDRKRLFASEYRDHLVTIQDRSEKMKHTVDMFVDYDKTQQKYQQLREHLEIVGD